MPGAERLKALCYKCGVNKWIVDFRGACASNISSVSICLSCEQETMIAKKEERIQKLENELRIVKEIVSKLEKKLEAPSNTAIK